MAFTIPGDLTGPEADTLRAVLAGHEDFFSAAVTVNGRRLTVLVALQESAGQRRPAPKPDGYAPGTHKTDTRQRTHVLTGEASSEPGDAEEWPA